MNVLLDTVAIYRAATAPESLPPAVQTFAGRPFAAGVCFAGVRLGAGDQSFAWQASATVRY